MLRGPVLIGGYGGGQRGVHPFRADRVGQPEGSQPGQQVLFDAGQGERWRRATRKAGPWSRGWRAKDDMK